MHLNKQTIKRFLKGLREKFFKQYRLDSFPVPIFVLGIMRGGTTFFTYRVADHPSILKLTQETPVFTELANIPIDSFENGCPHLDKDYISQVNVNSLLYNLATQINEEKKGRSFFKRGIERYQKGYGGIIKNFQNFYVMLKTGHFLNKVTLLKEIFPQAKFLMVIRDIHSHTYSLERHFIKHFQRGWAEHISPENEYDCFPKKKVNKMNKNKLPEILINDFEALPKTCINLNYIALRELEKSCPGDYLVVNFKRFKEETKSELDRIYDFLNLKQIAYTGKNKLFNNYTKAPLSEWKTKMDKAKIEIINSCIEENKTKYSYILQAIDY